MSLLGPLIGQVRNGCVITKRQVRFELSPDSLCTTDLAGWCLFPSEISKDSLDFIEREQQCFTPKCFCSEFRRRVNVPLFMKDRGSAGPSHLQTPDILAITPCSESRTGLTRLGDCITAILCSSLCFLVLLSECRLLVVGGRKLLRASLPSPPIRMFWIPR